MNRIYHHSSSALLAPKSPGPCPPSPLAIAMIMEGFFSRPDHAFERLQQGVTFDSFDRRVVLPTVLKMYSTTSGWPP